MELSSNLSQRQSFALSPEMRRSFEIMQAPSWQLSEIISKELSENPALEFPGANEPVSIQDFSSRKEKKKESEDSEDADKREIFRSEKSDEVPDNYNIPEIQKRRDFFFNSIAFNESTSEKLLKEAKLNSPNDETFKAFEFFVGELDDRGFLPKDSLERAERAGFSKESAEAALSLIKNSEPFGIGAFDMRESLMTQLKKRGLKDSVCYKILDSYFDLLMGRKIGELSSIFKMSEEELMGELDILKNLSTSPARELRDDSPEFVSADIAFLKKPDGSFEAELTNEHIPKLKINPEYRSMVSTGKSGDHQLNSGELSAVREKIREAKSLIGMIEDRQNTLLKIGKSILSRQEDFMINGREALRPMTMQDVAGDIGVHATTVGRAVNEKYADTPHGIMPLRDFFSGSYSSTGEGEDVASSSVKERIREIISAEPKRKPYSDAKIAEILNEENISIKRRTVAKYREALGIPPKSGRRIF